MKKASEQILQVLSKSQTFCFSIVEKQNDSGIMFNDRIFFLLPGKHIGYLSECKYEISEQINFEKHKAIIPISSLRSLQIVELQLHIKFINNLNNKLAEKKWILRMKGHMLVRDWHEKLQKEINQIKKMKELINNTQLQSPKKQRQASIVKVRQSSQSPKKRQLEFSRSQSISFVMKKPMEYKDVSIGDSARIISHNDIGIVTTQSNTEQKQTQQFGVIVHQKSVVKLEKQPQNIDYAHKINEEVRQQQPDYFERTSKLIKKNPKGRQPDLNVLKKPIESEQAEIIIRNEDKNQIKPLTPIKLLNLSHIDQSPRQIINQPIPQTNEQQIIQQIQNNQYIQEKPSVIEVTFEKNQQLPWTYKYLKFNEAMFSQFEMYTKELLQDIIQDLKQPLNKRTFKQSQFINNISIFNVEDLVVKLAFIEIQTIQSSRNKDLNYCNKSSIKILENEFNNFHSLYQYLGNNKKLKVPLVSLCEINGFVALFKLLPRKIDKLIRMREIEAEIKHLKIRSKIDYNFYQNYSHQIIQLDSQYYKSFTKEDDDLFDCYFIQEAQDYLLPDLVTDLSTSKLALLRKQLLQRSKETEIRHLNLSMSRSVKNVTQKSNKQIGSIFKNMFKEIEDLIVEMDSLNVYFYNSKEFSSYLHMKGVNVRYLGHIYQHLNTNFQKAIVMTEIAVRSCKSLFRKTIQDITLEENASSPQINTKICEFLNCVVGNTYESVAIWNVLSQHSISYFGVQINFKSILQGYFIISLSQNCRLDVNWAKIRPQQVFKNNYLFNESNLSGLKAFTKIYLSHHNQKYITCRKILNQPQTKEGFEELLDMLNSSGELPYWAKQIENEIRMYATLFVDPHKSKQQQYRNLNLYYYSQRSLPSNELFDMMLMQIKWYLKLKDRDSSIQCCDYFLQLVTKFCGEYHPIFSEFYDIYSSYHLANGQFEDAITFAKSSFVNILKICGTTHQKTSECYFQLALTYIKANRKQEALVHLKKSKLIFQNADKVKTTPYALILLKLAYLYLNQDQINESLKSCSQSMEILQRESPSDFEEQIAQCYQIMARCYELLSQKEKIQNMAYQCSSQIQFIKQPHNLQKMLKIYLYPTLASIKRGDASNYLSLINLIPRRENEDLYFLSCERIKERIAEQTFIPNLNDYLCQLSSIVKYIRQTNILKNWKFSQQVYDRQTVTDFISMTDELIGFVGLSFIVGTLRQAE